MSIYLEYWGALERAPHAHARMLRPSIGGRWLEEFTCRRWVKPGGYSKCIYEDFLGEDVEVEITLNEEAGSYTFINPNRCDQILTRPLSDVALYQLQTDVWLNDLATLMGIESWRLSKDRTKIENHLWHLGDVRIAGTHSFAPVFITKRWHRAPKDEVQKALEDPVWLRGGVVAQHSFCNFPQVFWEFLNP